MAASMLMLEQTLGIPMKPMRVYDAEQEARREAEAEGFLTRWQGSQVTRKVSLVSLGKPFSAFEK